MRKYVYAIIVMVLLTPLGLLAEGTAWGEWGPDELKELLGFVPNGMEHFPVNWEGVLPDYAFPNGAETFLEQAGAYITSAVIGIVLIMGIFYLSRHFLSKAVR